jgi:hypothetical protein
MLSFRTRFSVSFTIWAPNGQKLPFRSFEMATLSSASAARYMALLISLLMLIASQGLASRAHAVDLVVSYDQSQLLRLPRPVASVIIGNPSIADVSVQSGSLLVVTGKTFGVTNIIALDADRNVIQDQRVVVTRDDKRTVKLTKGGAQQSYTCTPYCSPTLTIGDDAAYFETISKHSTTKTQISDPASSGETQNPQ